MTSWTEIMMSQPLYENAFILRRPTVANLLTLSILQLLLKKPLNTQKRLKELESLCSNAIYICISSYSKIC